MSACSTSAATCRRLMALRRAVRPGIDGVSGSLILGRSRLETEAPALVRLTPSSGVFHPIAYILLWIGISFASTLEPSTLVPRYISRKREPTIGRGGSESQGNLLPRV